MADRGRAEEAVSRKSRRARKRAAPECSASALCARNCATTLTWQEWKR